MSEIKTWTGERLETFVFNDNTVEHLHRYAITFDYIKGKTVLDIASGEGYGSNLLSKYAEKVFGVDIDETSISKMGFNWITVHLNQKFNPNTEKLKRNFYTSSSCGVCGKESIEAIHQTRKIAPTILDLKVDLKTIFTLPEKLFQVQKTFQSTGGIHAAAFFNISGTLLEFREDVGRHNALDKLIGAEFLKSNTEDFFIQDKILLLSGRASFELLQKAAMANVPIVCAIGAPSSLAIETAENFRITLIGFLKNGSCNIYTNAERVKNLS